MWWGYAGSSCVLAWGSHRKTEQHPNDLSWLRLQTPQGRAESGAHSQAWLCLPGHPAQCLEKVWVYYPREATSKHPAHGGWCPQPACLEHSPCTEQPRMRTSTAACNSQRASCGCCREMTTRQPLLLTPAPVGGAQRQPGVGGKATPPQLDHSAAPFRSSSSMSSRGTWNC